MVHWTEELFVDNPELFFAVFDVRTEHVPMEVDYLLGKLKEHGFQSERILDLNCGVSRHSLELGKRGVQVVGTDISPTYIKLCGEKAEEAGIADKAAFRVADMREIASILAGEESFDGIINMWTAFGYYDEDTNEDILRQCVKLIRPGGFFIMDIINRDWLIRGFAENGFSEISDMVVMEKRKLDILTSRMINEWTYLKKMDDGNYQTLKTINLDHRVWSLHELISLYEKAGLEHTATYAGFGPGFSPEQKPLENLRELLQSRMLFCIGRRT